MLHRKESRWFVYNEALRFFERGEHYLPENEYFISKNEMWFRNCL